RRFSSRFCPSCPTAFFFFCFLIPLPLRSPLFPYTTLFRSLGLLLDERVAAAGGAPLARPEVLRGAQHPVETVAGLEDQVDQALGPGIGELGADPVPAGAVPGHAAVQRVHDRILDGGFPRSRLPFEQEHAAGAERGEVDMVLVAEGADAAQTQVVEFHEASVLSARTAW